MKARIDASRCEARGYCAKYAPGVFELDDDGYGRALFDGDIQTRVIELDGWLALGATGRSPSSSDGSEMRPTCQSCMTMVPPFRCTVSVIGFHASTWASE